MNNIYNIIIYSVFIQNNFIIFRFDCVVIKIFYDLNKLINTKQFTKNIIRIELGECVSIILV